MRKMKKVLSLAMTAAMTASLLTGMGAVTASAKKSDDGKRTKITALLNSTESTEQYQVYDYLLKNFCDEKGIDYEIEMVNDKQDYFSRQIRQRPGSSLYAGWRNGDDIQSGDGRKLER